MLERVRNALEERANGKTIGAVAIAFLLFAAGILPRIQAAMKAESGGVGPIDLRLRYTPDEAYRMIEAYGEHGRRRYALVESTVDVAYPLTYATLIALVFTYGSRRAYRHDHPLNKASLVPYGVMLVDYVENVGIVTMLLRYPARYPMLARLTSVVTLLKWISFGVSMALTVVTLGIAGKNRLHK